RQHWLLGEDRREIAEPKASVHLPVAVRDEPRDRRGEIGPQRDEAAVAVEELDEPLRGRLALGVLDHGRLDGDVAVCSESLAEALLDEVELARFRGQYVTEAARRCVPALRVQRLTLQTTKKASLSGGLRIGDCCERAASPPASSDLPAVGRHGCERRRRAASL